jgi:hypothetical protein
VGKGDATMTVRSRVATSRKMIAAGPLPLPGEESFHQLENDGGAISPGAAAALITLVPRLPAFAANLAQHATDGSHDLVR